MLAMQKALPAEGLLLLGFLLVPAGLPGAVVEGRITDCGAGAPGLQVVAYEEVVVGTGGGEPCGNYVTTSRNAGQAFTNSQGTYRIIYTETLPAGTECSFAATVYVKVFFPDVPTWTSPPQSFQEALTFDVEKNLIPGTGGCPPPFVYFFEGPSTVFGTPDQDVEFEVEAFLEQNVATENGAETWVAVVGGEGCTPVRASFSGTVAASTDSDPPGLLCPEGFRFIFLSKSGTGDCENRRAVISGADVLQCGFTLPPAGGPHRILRVTLQAKIPPPGETRHCEVRFVNGCLRTPLDPIPDINVLWYKGLETYPALRSLTVELKPQPNLPPFRRGDANADGSLDISDGVAIFAYLFLGGNDLPCKDAADATDDGALDISDGIRILSLLFTGGGPLPGPADGACGTDPVESLGCERYLNCAGG